MLPQLKKAPENVPFTHLLLQRPTLNNICKRILFAAGIKDFSKLQEITTFSQLKDYIDTILLRTSSKEVEEKNVSELRQQYTRFEIIYNYYCGPHEEMDNDIFFQLTRLELPFFYVCVKIDSVITKFLTNLGKEINMDMTFILEYILEITIEKHSKSSHPLSYLFHFYDNPITVGEVHTKLLKLFQIFKSTNQKNQLWNQIIDSFFNMEIWKSFGISYLSIDRRSQEDPNLEVPLEFS